MNAPTGGAGFAAAAKAGRVSVVIPTYRRPEDLRRCLHAVAAQTVPPFEIMVVHRPDDGDTAELARAFPSVRMVTVDAPGQVAALNRGLDAASGAIIAILDDDAAPRPDWLARLAAHFAADPELAGVGGRDVIGGDDAECPASKGDVGRVQWFGRTIGNHHLGRGPARAVDILKGANMSFRRSRLGGLRFDPRLRGSGAQVANDMAFCLALRSRGARLLYDPAVAVDHFPARRHDEDARGRFSAIARRNAAHNETLVLLEFLPAWRRAVFVLWAFAIGTRAVPGAAQWVRLRLLGETDASARVRAAASGRLAGIATWFRGRSGRGRDGRGRE